MIIVYALIRTNYAYFTHTHNAHVLWSRYVCIHPYIHTHYKTTVTPFKNKQRHKKNIHTYITVVKGQITAAAVLVCTVKRAWEAHTQTHCLTSLISESMNVAHARDTHMRADGTPIGPLHGVPLSLKENIGIEGEDVTTGIAKRCDMPYEQTAAVVQVCVCIRVYVYMNKRVYMFNSTQPYVCRYM